MNFCVNAVSGNAPNRVACCKLKENKQLPQLTSRRSLQLQALAFCWRAVKLQRCATIWKGYSYYCENNNKRCENKKCSNITRGLALQILRDCSFLLHKLDLCFAALHLVSFEYSRRRWKLAWIRCLRIHIT